MKETLEDMLIRHEGMKLTPYLDTLGNYTCGVGHELTSNEKPSVWTRDKALTVLQTDIKIAKDSLLKALPWVKTLDEDRLNVLLDMTFNMGINRLLKFKNTLKAIQEGRYSDAADGMLNSLWAREVKDRAFELAKIMKGSEGS